MIELPTVEERELADRWHARDERYRALRLPPDDRAVMAVRAWRITEAAALRSDICHDMARTWTPPRPAGRRSGAA